MAGRRWEFEYHPVGMDALSRPKDHPAPGTRVVLDPERDRRPGKRTHALVVDAETGEFVGNLPRAALMRVSKKRGGNPQPVATDRLAGIMRDRR